MAELNLNFEYQLRRGGLLDGLKVSVRADGVVRVRAGKMFSVGAIEEFLWSKKDWIESARAQAEETKLKAKNTAGRVEIFGKKYQKVVGNWPEKKVGVSVEEGRILINMNGANGAKKGAGLAARAEEKLADFLKLTAEKYIKQRVPQLAAKMKLEGKYNRVVLKKQTTRWGSCSSDKNLNFNWTLVYYEPKIIDYVLIHELAHLREMNHSAQFWKIVAEFDPAYKTHRRALKN